MPHIYVNKNVYAYTYMCMHMYIGVYKDVHMPLYIKFHVFTHEILCIHIYITCIRIHTHRHIFIIVFLLKRLNASPPSKGKYLSSSPLLPLYSFVPSHLFPFLYFSFGSSFEVKPPHSGFSFSSFHSQAQICDRDKVAQGHLSCFFLFPKA